MWRGRSAVLNGNYNKPGVLNKCGAVGQCKSIIPPNVPDPDCVASSPPAEIPRAHCTV